MKPVTIPADSPYIDPLHKEACRKMHQWKQRAHCGGHDVKSNPHLAPPTAGIPVDGPMGGPLMGFTNLLEAPLNNEGVNENMAEIGNKFLNSSERASEQRAHTAREDHNRSDKGGAGHDVKSNPTVSPGGGGTPMGVMGDISSFTQLLEMMMFINENMDEQLEGMDDLTTMSVGTPTMGATGGNDDELLGALNEIFTPILITQSIEGNLSDQINEACSEGNVLLERNIIRFDDSSRMSQLISVCAQLIHRQKGTEQYKMFREAARTRNKMKLEMQKSEFEAARALATRYLVQVSTSNNSSVARKAAQNMLPATQH